MASRPRVFPFGHRLSLLLGLLILAVAGGTSAFEVNEEGFSTPVLDDRFVPQRTVLIDLTDEIDGKETLVREFLNLVQEDDTYVGFSVFMIAGEVFAYLVNAKTIVDGQVTYGFMLVDGDGDGIFEAKYAAAETAEVPAWVIERALRLMEKAGSEKR